MCQFPMNFAQGYALVPLNDNEKAQRAITFIRVMLCFQLGAAVCFFLAKRTVDGTVDLMSAAAGMVCVWLQAEEMGVNPQSVVCYGMFCFVFMFWAMIRVILFYLGNQDARFEMGPLEPFQWTTFQVGLVADVVIYCVLVMLIYVLFVEIKEVAEQTQDRIVSVASTIYQSSQIVGQATSGRNRYGYSQVSTRDDDTEGVPEAKRNNTAEPKHGNFTGQGFKLSDD